MTIVERQRMHDAAWSGRYKNGIYFNPAEILSYKRETNITNDVKSRVLVGYVKNLDVSQRSRFYSSILNDIEKLKYLPINWDSYGAPSPNERAVSNAEMVAALLSETEFEPTRIMPFVEGGISFLFVSGEKYADIECDNDGEILAGMSDRSSEPTLWEPENSKIDMVETIERIRAFLSE